MAVTMEIDHKTIRVDFAKPVGIADERVYLAVLSDDEVRRAERFHFDRDRQLFVTSRGLVRKALSKYINVDPAAWRFEKNSFGRPEIIFPSEGRVLRFSASNTDGLAMCAVAFNRDIGADVEYLREPPLDVVDCSFAPVEAQSVLNCSGNERSERFFEYWTLKESYAKARGLGLSIPFNKFAFHLNESQPPRLEIDPGLVDQASEWRFWSWRPTQIHCAALCVRSFDQLNVSFAAIDPTR
jgi:4'-phosphopantetheinyl transferase